MMSAQDLLAGSALRTTVEIPQCLLGDRDLADRRVRLKPLSVHDLQLISRAARENEELTAALMVQRALVEPELAVQQIATMSAGLLEYLLREVTRISGIHVSEEELADAVQDPLAQASFQLAREYGWTPEEIGGLTLGQIMVHLHMQRAGRASGARAS